MPPLVGYALVDYDQCDVSNDDTQGVGNDGQKAGDHVLLVLLLVLLPMLVSSTWWFRWKQGGGELVGDPGRL